MVYLIVVDGLIGGGKSTILASLKKLGYKIEQQRISEWTHLVDFYQNPKEFAMSLQRQIIKSYNDIYLQYKDDYSKEFVFVESFGLASLSSFCSMLHQDNLLTNSEMDELNYLVIKWKPSLYLWVETDVETSLRRIKGRGRKGEDGIPSDYLQRLKKCYQAFMASEEHGMVIRVIDNNKDEEQNNVVELIQNKFLSSDSKFDVAIEGNIASGKTTFVKRVAEKFCPIEQLITEKIQEMLERRYENGKGWAFELQKEFIKMYADQMKNCSSSRYNGWEGVLSFLHVFCQAALQRGEISKREFNELAHLYDRAGLPSLEDFKVVVWIRPSIDQNMYRIGKRERPGEDQIERSYIELLDKLYWNYLGLAKNILIVDNEHQTFPEIERLIHAKLQEVYFR